MKQKAFALKDDLPVPYEGRTTSRTKGPTSEIKPHDFEEGMKSSKNTFHGYKHYTRGQTAKTRKKPNTTSKATPQGARTVSMAGQGGKEHLEGPLVASRPLEIIERREERRVKQPSARNASPCVVEPPKLYGPHMLVIVL